MAIELHGQVSERDHEKTKSVGHAPEHTVSDTAYINDIPSILFCAISQILKLLAI